MTGGSVATAVVVAFVLRALWLKLKSPNRPGLIVFLDALFEIPAFLRIGPWRNKCDVTFAVAEAIRETKLTEFGMNDNGSFIERRDKVFQIGLQNSGARFSPAGHAVIQYIAVKKMKERLQMIDYFKRHPSIEKIEIKPPVFVVGLTRTGTTFLHEKLGLHEKFRSHYTWEQLNPLPSTESEDVADHQRDREQRYKEGRKMFNFVFKYLVGEKIQYIHRIGYDEPEECTVPCSFDLPWSLSELPLHIFAAEETFPMGAGKAFFLYRKFLQLFTWQDKNRRDHDFTWMLKCPFHLPYLKELAEAFPGATIVWTHRDPAQCIASACSLFETLMHMGMEESTVDRKAIGAAIMKYSHLCIALAERSIEELAGKINIVHVRYQDNVSKPKDVCKDVCKAAGMPFTAEYEANLDEYLRRNEEERQRMKEKAGKAEMHEYRPEDYGLTKERIREEFKDYISKYRL